MPTYCISAVRCWQCHPFLGPLTGHRWSRCPWLMTQTAHSNKLIPDTPSSTEVEPLSTAWLQRTHAAGGHAECPCRRTWACSGLEINALQRLDLRQKQTRTSQVFPSVAPWHGLSTNPIAPHLRTSMIEFPRMTMRPSGACVSFSMAASRDGAKVLCCCFTAVGYTALGPQPPAALATFVAAKGRLWAREWPPPDELQLTLV